MDQQIILREYHEGLRIQNPQQRHQSDDNRNPVINGMITSGDQSHICHNAVAQVSQLNQNRLSNPTMASNVQNSIVNDVSIVGNRYQVVRKLANGSFGELCLGIDVSTGENVAIKLERKDAMTRRTLDKESKILYGIQGAVGVPIWKYYGIEGNFRALVMQLLGPNLSDLFRTCSNRFSVKTTLMLANQLLCRLEHVHARNIIHRDLKPENFVMGLEPGSKMVYLIDFGLSKRYRSATTLQHIHEKVGKSRIVGNARFCSLKCHMGHEISRRDDLESLAYNLIYFLKGSLPWQGVRGATTAQIVERVKERKMSITADILCLGCPEVFLTFLLYCRNLGFTETPDYSYIRQIFTRTMYQLRYQPDNNFDWLNTGNASTSTSANHVAT